MIFHLSWMLRGDFAFLHNFGLIGLLPSSFILTIKLLCASYIFTITIERPLAQTLTICKYIYQLLIAGTQRRRIICFLDSRPGLHVKEERSQAKLSCLIRRCSMRGLLFSGQVRPGRERKGPRKATC